jgi:glucosamine--fructose-6-phosphate aminotransferase (isomerizing)
VVHNGIIENFSQLKQFLQNKGHHFTSDTDTEVIAHLIALNYQGNLTEAVFKTTKQLEGAYALAVMSVYEPDKIIAFRQSSPLIVGIGQGEHYIGSDIAAMLEHTRSVIILDEGELAVLTGDRVELFDQAGNAVAREPFYVHWNVENVVKTGFEHYMLKEIFDQPDAFRRMLSEYMPQGEDTALHISLPDPARLQKIHLVACGTAYHAALVGKYVLERMLRIPAEAEIASEFRYREPVLNEHTLVIAVSQSGETADTLAAIREAKNHGAPVLAITNVVGSTMTREADAVLYTHAGPEISVASTKAYTTQLIMLYLLSIHLAKALPGRDKLRLRQLANSLKELPVQAESVLANSAAVKKLAVQMSGYDHAFFVGRGLDYTSALEGSLKLKEITYIHSEAYAAGELKHGTLALIEEGTPVIALLTQNSLADKMISNIKEVKARGAVVWGIAAEGRGRLEECMDRWIALPQTDELLMPVLSAIPLQLLAYYTSVAKGIDVDKPRNLAKSVTVE